MKLNKPIPIEHPLLNAQVCGQDTVQAVVRGEQIYWFWGDTDRLSYPLGQFNTSGAVSRLPTTGGLSPGKGVNLDYFVDESGFSRPMFPQENGVLIWVHGVFTLEDEAGRTRILTHYSRRKSLTEQLSHGIAVFDDATHRFQPLVDLSEDQPLHPRGQAFRVETAGRPYIYFASPYATVRVPANWKAALDPRQYEGFTALPQGTQTIDSGSLNLKQMDRDSEARLRFTWKRNTATVSSRQLAKWTQAGTIDAADNPFRTVDVATGKEVLLHAGSIHWNVYRQRWILVAHEVMGEPSNLGEVWYSESRQPEGPFRLAVRIATHQRYSFYNVTQHPFFDEQDGRVVYFEGTFTKMFSRTQVPTPWYDYNQILYRLDLGDERLRGAFVEGD